MRKLFLLLSFVVFLFSAEKRAELFFDLYKKESGIVSPTMLIVGGIHGDEPGGYFAPSIFVKHYKILSGSVWVVPNLNRDSIIQNKRGVYGDMNRKFSKIDSKDPDFKIVEEIKKIMLDTRVDIILNLHDGYGFYRKNHLNGLMNPSAWGQATIIDQQKIDGVKFGNLSEIAEKVTKSANVEISEDINEMNVKNTDTKNKDIAMQQTLTYFAITNKKPGFAIETSKQLDSLKDKVFYQLKAIEEFMNIVGIRFKRDFELSNSKIQALIDDYGTLEFSNKIKIPLNDIKDNIKFFPFDGNLLYKSDNPNITLKKDKNIINIYNGHIKISTLKTDSINFDILPKEIEANIDGSTNRIKVGNIIYVDSKIALYSLGSDYRLNWIGFTTAKQDEFDIFVKKEDFDKSYSMDKKGEVYRAEVYKGKSYCGTIVVKFK